MNNSTLAATGPASPTIGMWVTYLFCALNFAGVILNSLVAFFILRPNVIPGKIPLAFLLNQVLGEGLCCLLRSFAWLTDQDWPVPDNDLGTFFCKIMYSRAIYFSAMHASYSNVILLAVERYISVVHSALHRKFTPPLIALVILLSWATGPLRTINRIVEPERRGTSCIAVPQDWRIYAPLVVFWSLVLPILIIAVLNARLIYVLKRQAENLKSAGNALRKRLQRDLTMSVMTTCLAFAVITGPQALTYLLMNFDVIKKDFRGVLYQSLSYYTGLFYIVNPLAYMFQMRAIRRQAVAFIRCHMIRSTTGRESQGDVSTSAATKNTTLKSINEGTA